MRFLAVSVNYDHLDYLRRYKPINLEVDWTQSPEGLYGVTPENTVLLLFGEWWRVDPLILRLVDIHLDKGGRAIFGNKSCIKFLDDYSRDMTPTS